MSNLTTRESLISWSLVVVAAVISVSIIVIADLRDRNIPVRYDCALLIGDWHPDFPKEVIEACRRKGIKYDSSKTSYR
jgi:hypothetical protein